MLPLSGVIINSGTIALQATGDETYLQLIQLGVTLDGHGQLNPVRRQRQRYLRRRRHANGTHALEIDTGANTVANTGTLEATGTGGLVVNSDVVNTGLLWANGGNLTANDAVSGSVRLKSADRARWFAGASSANTTFDSASWAAIRPKASMSPATVVRPALPVST